MGEQLNVWWKRMGAALFSSRALWLGVPHASLPLSSIRNSPPTGRRRPKSRKLGLFGGLLFAVSVTLLSGGCFEDEAGEPYYGKAAPPRTQEFRWSDGGVPQIFDPARAAAPPDTDVVRALFEGLTDYDPQTLVPSPAVARRWERSADHRTWTFHLREDAYWSNGDRVTARDFVRSWQRTLRLGERAPHSKLLFNIRGARELASSVVPRPAATPPPPGQPSGEPGDAAGTSEATPQVPQPFGVEALDERTLRVRLVRPDKSFPSLVAHPVFRPVHELSPVSELSQLHAEEELGDGAATSIVTNGAFRLSGLNGARVTLERDERYWDASSVRLDRVHFVASGSSEEALAAYRAGEVDALSNAALEPMAVKMLSPYKDFRRHTYAALTYYKFNPASPPFDDPRVREALAAVLDLERLSKDTLGGATEPARRFLPQVPQGEDPVEGAARKPEAAVDDDGSRDGRLRPAAPLRRDVELARRLLAEAGFPGGTNFPRVRLLVNRNEQQRLLAQAVARTWKEELGVETEIILRPWEEYEEMLRAGDYDVARQSLVMQTTDEATNLLAMFGERQDARVEAANPEPGVSAPTVAEEAGAGEDTAQEAVEARPPYASETQALRELPAIPIYFATSYAMVKPYVNGFHSNLLDAPSLKHVSIDTGWKPPQKKESIRPGWSGAGR